MNRNSPWLFPGRRAGQPMSPGALAALVNDIGVPTIAGRASAIRHHVLEMPAPVVADALSARQQIHDSWKGEFTRSSPLHRGEQDL